MYQVLCLVQGADTVVAQRQNAQTCPSHGGLGNEQIGRKQTNEIDTLAHTHCEGNKWDVRENKWDGVRVYRRREAGIGDPELIFGG